LGDRVERRTVIDRVVDRFAQNHPRVPGETVAAVVNDWYALFDGRIV
jgi:hypothetical protein